MPSAPSCCEHHPYSSFSSADLGSVSVSTKKGAGLIDKQAHLSTQAVSCYELSNKRLKPLQLSFSKSFVCDGSFLLWNTFFFFFCRQSTFVLSQQSSYTAPGYSFSTWIMGGLLSFPALFGNLLERKGISPGENLFLGVLSDWLLSSSWIPGRSRGVWTQLQACPLHQ